MGKFTCLDCDLKVNRPNSRCRPHAGAARRKPDKMTPTEATRLFRERHPEQWASSARKSALKTRYGITPDEYERMLEYQGGLCYLCGNPPKKMRLSVDHDHKTGLIRGLLCFRCNLRLGREREPAWFLRTAEYLTAPPAPLALGRQPQGVVGRVTNKRRRRRRA